MLRLDREILSNQRQANILRKVIIARAAALKLIPCNVIDREILETNNMHAKLHKKNNKWVQR